jgi:hypothetical protein
MSGVHVKSSVYGTVGCPQCGTEFDINNPGGEVKESQPRAKKAKLTQADIFYRFLMSALVGSVILGLLKELLLK